MTLLSVRNLRLRFPTEWGEGAVLNGLDFAANGWGSWTKADRASRRRAGG